MIISSKKVDIPGFFQIGGDSRLSFILGPCVLEDEIIPIKIAGELKKLSEKYKFNLIFKGSFDKANRTSIHSFRGIGLEKGVRLLNKIRNEFNIPVITDIHDPSQVEYAAEYVDILQIPAFLIRQTDLVEKAAVTGRVLNLKKAQFLSPFEMEHVVSKVEESGNSKYFITDRGTFFGYNRLVNDFKYFPVYKKWGPLCFDATHSVQLPGAGSKTGGEPEYIDNLCYAAIASFVDIIFCETHFSREQAKSDASNLILLEDLDKLIPKMISLSDFVRNSLFGDQF